MARGMTIATHGKRYDDSNAWQLLKRYDVCRVVYRAIGSLSQCKSLVASFPGFPLRMSGFMRAPLVLRVKPGNEARSLVEEQRER